MFKFFALCLFAIVALAAAKPQFLTYSAAPVVAATPYASGVYTSGLYASPYAAAYTAPYAAAYSAYPYSSVYLRR